MAWHSAGTCTTDSRGGSAVAQRFEPLNSWPTMPTSTKGAAAVVASEGPNMAASCRGPTLMVLAGNVSLRWVQDPMAAAATPMIGKPIGLLGP
jgi:catalase (peroxidase I)